MNEQHSTPLNLGDVVHATVKRVEVFGIFFQYLEHEILVLIPEISWIPCFASCKQVAEIGDKFQIKIVAYVENQNQYAGSIRGLHPENDPWSGSWQLQVGDEIEATVIRFVESADRCQYGHGYLIELRAAVFVMLCGQERGTWENGQKCRVVVRLIDDDRKSVLVQLATQ